MVLVRMRTHHIFQSFHIALPKVILNFGSLIVISRVYQHCFPAAEQQSAVALTHIKEMDFQLLCHIRGACG